MTTHKKTQVISNWLKTHYSHSSHRALEFSEVCLLKELLAVIDERTIMTETKWYEWKKSAKSRLKHLIAKSEGRIK